MFCALVYGQALTLPYQFVMLVTVMLAVLLIRAGGAWEVFAWRNAWVTTGSVRVTSLMLSADPLMIGCTTKTSGLNPRSKILAGRYSRPAALVLGKLRDSAWRLTANSRRIRTDRLQAPVLQLANIQTFNHEILLAVRLRDGSQKQRQRVGLPGAPAGDSAPRGIGGESELP